MKPVKIAQIGTGHDHAYPTCYSLMKNSDVFELIGIAEPNPEKIRNLETVDLYRRLPHFTVEQLLEMDTLEAVTVENEEHFSTAVAQKFAQKGVAIHLDKPGTAGTESFAQLVQTMKAHERPLQLGYMYRYNPLIQQALKLAREGELGTIFSVEAQMSVCHPPEKRQWLGQYPGGMMYYLGCHLVDLVLLFQGMPDQVTPLNLSTGIDEVTAEDYGFALLRYPHGSSFVKTCACECNGYARRQLVVCGSRGTIELKPLESPCPGEGAPVRTVGAALVGDASSPWRDCARQWDSGVFDRYDTMLREFAKYVRGEAENPYSYDYELALFRTIMSCCGVKE